VQTFSGRHLNVHEDGTVEMPVDDAKCLISYGRTTLGWSFDEGPLTHA
jgi:hypothetical protein